MKKWSKKFISFMLASLMVCSAVMCNTYKTYAAEQMDIINVGVNDKITLENGESVTPLEFLQMLEDYDGEIYYINDEFLESIAKSTGYENNIMERSAAISMSDVMKVMAGTWYIPGIGKIIVAGGTIVIGGVAIYKVSGWIANQVKNWLTKRAIAKQVDKAVSELGGVDSNRANHILNVKHKWSSLVPGGPKDPNRWNKIKEIIKKVMNEGKETKYGGAYKRTLKYKGKEIEVTFQKLQNGIIKISNAWVK